MKTEAKTPHQIAEEKGTGRRESSIHVLHEHHQLIGLGARLDFAAWSPPNIALLWGQGTLGGQIREVLLRYPGSLPVAGDLSLIFGWPGLRRHCEEEIGSGAELGRGRRRRG